VTASVIVSVVSVVVVSIAVATVKCAVIVVLCVYKCTDKGVRKQSVSTICASLCYVCSSLRCISLGVFDL
jgi:hypothetical protein